jgi:DNA topoisomerase IB
MPRLRTVSTRDPGWSRVHHGRGFRYLDVDGSPLDPAEVERVKALVIPPAWRDVWISPYPNAHLQAVGTDDAGRRQYLYHPLWRAKRDEDKFDRVIAMAAKLPRVRKRLREDLGTDGGLGRESALAAAVRLVDLGCFRLGSDTYTTTNGSYGLTTLERRHVRRRKGGGFVFSFTGKSGVEHEIELADAQVCAVLDVMTRRRRPEDRLLSVKVNRRWVALQPSDINEYIRDLFGLDVSAKDFRTWHATVHVASALGEWVLDADTRPREATKTARKKVVRQAIVGASELLGNTPTVCRASYVDPRVIDLYESDVTIAPALAKSPKDPEKARDHLDRAVVRLLAD